MNRVPGRALVAFLFLGAWLGADQVNIAPDAVTRATEGYNEYEGDLAYLTDGLHPGNHEDAGAFVWPSKGNLIFEFEEARPMAGMRIYVGDDAGYYWIAAYRGAFFGETGQTNAAEAVLVADVNALDQQANTWVEVAFPPESEADYIEMQTQSSAAFYEIEILQPAADPSAVRAVSWAGVKLRHGGRR